ncbi:BTB/POZ domain-containing protein [Rhynchospora pubera]|uniref:BTB/POZ domain-containing protein n=1 Tax=Rhynchospora pubera TaxID=906938 RepID=A0AAV8FJ65_9POAL|nr:BTB/POZ domain-containing protein [Rhynchospora pubera]
MNTPEFSKEGFKAFIIIIPFLSQVIINTVFAFSSFKISEINKLSTLNLRSRSPVFKAMLATDMEESRTGVIKIPDASPKVLESFVSYLYTAETTLDEDIARDLLILADKYQVDHLKEFCERYMTSNVTYDNAIVSYAFAHLHNAKLLQDAARSLIIENIDMGTLMEREDYKELSEQDPHLIVKLYEAYYTNLARTKDSNVEV